MNPDLFREIPKFAKMLWFLSYFLRFSRKAHGISFEWEDGTKFFGSSLKFSHNYISLISNLLSFYTICFWTAFSSILFAFANLREKIWAHDLHCGENSFSMAARYPDWVDEMMGEALWWEIWFIVNKPKRNVELKSIIGEVHCKHEKCCASEPFTEDDDNFL